MSAYGPNEFQAQFNVSRETMDALEVHRAQLERQSKVMNLVGPKEVDLYWQRHAADSAQLVALAPTAIRWVDLGSGAGFPGIIVAGLLKGRAGAEVHLVESTTKKCRFLTEVIAEAGLPATVHNQRIEDFGAGPGRFDVVTARALAPLNRLIPYAKPILDRGAQGLFHKGADLDAELAAAKNVLGGAYQADVLESLSDPRGRIVRVTRVP